MNRHHIWYNTLVMKKYPALKLAPVVEAVFCVDFAGLPQLTQKGATLLMQATDEKYVKKGDLVSRSLLFDMVSPGHEVKPETTWNGVRFQNGDSDIVVLSNLEPQVVRFCYSRLKPYDSWNAFVSTGQRLLDGFVAVQKTDPIVKRIGIRYVNQIKVPLGKCKLSDILLCAPMDPVDVPDIESREFFYRETSYYGQYGLNATSIKSTQKTQDGNPIVVVDFDVFDTPNTEMSRMDWPSILERAHGLKNALFFGTVTEKAYSGALK